MLVALYEKGQGLVEYALILLLIAMAVIIAVTAFGTELRTAFDFVTGKIPDV